MHPIVFELISKAKELAKITGQLVGVLVIGCNTKPIVEQLLNFGVDLVYACDHESLKEYNLVTYKNVFIDFVQTYKPSSILVGATNYGRAIAPGVAAHFKTGMTADCTKLEMEPNTDLIQIRPAFGGSIMAKIKTPNTRPQICTVRYKVFDKNNNLKFNNGKVVNIPFKSDFLSDDTKLLNIITKKTEVDLVDADVIVVVGKGFKKKEDLSLAYDLAKLLNGQVGCTRPLIENN
jgi:electron transfer flavoprotein alpha subunit